MATVDLTRIPEPAARRAVEAHRATLTRSGGERRTHTDRHGITTVYTVWHPPRAPHSVAQILHGVGEHSARYLHVVDALLAEGYLVVADDHRGHGETGVLQHGSLAKLGGLGPGGIAATVDAVHQIGVDVAADAGHLPLVLIGHSWGSFLAQKAVNRWSGDYAAVVLTGTALALPGSINSGDLNTRFRAEGVTGFEWLSRDTAVRAAAAADPLMFGGTVLHLFGLRGAIAVLTAPARGIRPQLPILIANGSDDAVANEKSVRRLERRYRARGLSDVTVTIYPEARHELYNETNRDEIIADVVGWMRHRR